MAGKEFISIQIDPAQVAMIESMLAGISGGPKANGFSAAAVAMQKAISLTVGTGKTRISTLIRRYVRLNKADVDPVIAVDRGSYESAEGSITVTRKRIALIKYLTSSQSAAVSRRLANTGLKNRSGLGRLKISTRRIAQGGYTTQETLPHAFVAVMPKSTHRGIFQREGKPRLPIRELQGPTPLGVFLHANGGTGRKLIDEAVADLGEVLEKNLNSQLDRFLK